MSKKKINKIAEEKAFDYQRELGMIDSVSDDHVIARRMGFYDGFIAGAEYQRKQDQSLIELAEDHAILAGMNKMKEEMMEKAVDGRYMKAASSVYVESWPLDIDPDSVKAGDEMKLIVVPKEK